MLSILVALVLILGGLAWMMLAFFAAGMADRAVDLWTEVWWPMSWGLVPILIGVALVLWR